MDSFKKHIVKSSIKSTRRATCTCTNEL